MMLRGFGHADLESRRAAYVDSAVQGETSAAEVVTPHGGVQDVSNWRSQRANNRAVITLSSGRNRTRGSVTISVLVIALVSCVGCQSAHRSHGGEIASEGTHPQAIEYSVYSHAIRLEARGRTVIVRDSTHRPYGGGEIRFCGARTPIPCVDRNPTVPSETWDDLTLKSRRRWLLQPLFDKDISVSLKRQSKPLEASCEAPTTISLSRVGFNADHTVAVVELEVATGKGPYPGCGVASGYFRILKRSGDSWRSIEAVNFWMS